ncbi:MAG: exodeoxyribonuclease V subunit gamma [Parachlamydiales bacterium]|jgi:exodeoxyribonuclease V gamma subunit
MRQERLFLSSSLENLAEALEKLLFSAPDLFQCDFIIVPSREIKDWLLNRLAKKNLAPLGLEFVLQDNLETFLASRFFPEASLPSFLELTLSVKQVFKTEGSQAFGGIFPQKTKKEVLFFKELAAVFKLYGLYLEKLEGWQKELFDKTGWSAFNQEWNQKRQTVKAENFSRALAAPFGKKCAFYLFAISYLPPLFSQIFTELSQESGVFHFLFSPCLYFWEDLLTDREKKRLRKRLAGKRELLLEWQSYLKEENPLLANFGSSLRFYLKNLRPEEMESFELFSGESEKNQAGAQLPETDLKEEKEKNFLKKVQNDLAFLANRKERARLSFQDGISLQVHGAPSKRRELEVLKQKLFELLNSEAKNSTEALKLSEIAVYVPKIEAYAPYIKEVFEGALPYRLAEEETSFFARGLMDFFRLMEGDFSKKELFSLLGNPAFQSCRQYREAEKNRWEECFERLNTQFALDESHFFELFQVKWPYQSFEYGLSRLISSLAFGFSSLGPYPVLPGLTMGDAESLEKFLQIFQSLKKEYLFFKAQPEKSLSDWGDYLIGWAENNLQTKGERKEELAFLALKKFVLELKKARVKGVFAFSDFAFYLPEALKGQSTLGFLDLPTIAFSSLPRAVPPHKVICLLGLNENFPTLASQPSYSLLEKVYLPEARDEELFCFLQALVSAQKTFYLSYVNLSEDGKKALPSLALQELVRYLDETYSMEGRKPSSLIFQEHAFLPFEAQAQSPKSPLLSEHLELKKAYFQKDARATFLVPLKNSPQVLPDEIDLGDLFLLAKNPLQFHFQKVLNCPLEPLQRGSSRLGSYELFDLNPLDLYHLRQQGKKEEPEKIVADLEKQGRLPPGAFGQLVRKKAQKALEDYRSSLKSLALDEKALVTVEFKKGQRVLEETLSFQNQKTYAAPPLEYDFKGRKISFVGRLKELSSGGLAVYAEDSFSNRFKCWPQLLVFLIFNQKYALFEEKLLFTKKALSIQVLLNDAAKAFGLFLEYYQEALGAFTYLYKGWEKPILENSPELLKRALKKSCAEVQEPYLKWLLAHSELPFFQEILRVKNPLFRPLFEPFLEFQKQCRS